jgi:hypothetical protein
VDRLVEVVIREDHGPENLSTGPDLDGIDRRADGLRVANGTEWDDSRRPRIERDDRETIVARQQMSRGDHGGLLRVEGGAPHRPRSIDEEREPEPVADVDFVDGLGCLVGRDLPSRARVGAERS